MATVGRSVIVAAVLLLAVLVPAAQAETGLQIRPLQYQTALRADEGQQGVVDIANPSKDPVAVELAVQAFRRADDGVEFYDDERVTAGVILDESKLKLEGKGAHRVVFEVDPARLPSGDVQAAIVATTADDVAGHEDMVAQRVSVATLLQISNGSAAAPERSDDDHEAMMTRLILGGGALVVVSGLVLAVLLRRRKKLVFAKRP